ncbi:hypothetical protein ACIBG4_13450 [Nonomuraea sp. NPDC050383]|uniref:hypothetical protein n=1 Tax=Nonomuraea sp. NPDC050383 TaxID=3364362 RepID=UPI0037A745D8
MTQPLTDQRARAELVAELYDSHAAGLFAYCADQLGDPGSAADVLMSVLAAVPASVPARAALYALARREIGRRDVAYTPPVVDPLIDPASALVERALHELRPHHREVLLLSEVCGLDRAELAWVLDVAPDTAGELLDAAAHRYRRLLGAALDRAAARRVPKPVADVYGALGVAPLRDVLGRLPWPEPPAALRVHFAGSRTAGTAPMFVRPRWPVPPVWPLPLGDRDPLTSTGLFPAELLKPPSPSRVPPHEATTEPMPTVGDPFAPTDRARPGTGLTRPWQAFTSARDQGLVTRGQPRTGDSGERPALRPNGGPGGGPGGDVFATGDVFPVPRAAHTGVLAGPVAGDVLDDEPATQEMPAIRAGDVLVHKTPDSPGATGGSGAPGSLFARRDRPAEPVYRLPLPADGDKPTPVTASASASTTTSSPTTTEPASEGEAHDAGAAAKPPKPRRDAPPKPLRSGRDAPPRPPRSGKGAPRKGRPRPRRHHDWAWELIGFLICVAIAMIVFFSVPAMLSP